MAIILVLYIVDGTEITQATIFGGAIIQLLVAIIFFVIGLTAYMPQATLAITNISFTDIFEVNLQIMIAGIVAFIADMFVIAIVYQGIRNLFKQKYMWLAVAVALTGALWTDAIIFNFIAAIGRGGFTEFIAGDIISKSIAALTVFPLVTLYLYRFAPSLPLQNSTGYRPTFDIIHNLYGSWRIRIIQLESELRETEINTDQLITNINEVFWIADEKDTYAHFISPAFDRLLKMERGIVYLTPDVLLDMIHIDDKQLMTGWLRYADTTHDIEFRIRSADGEDLWLRDRTYRVVDEKLGIQRVIGISEDITAQKERQALETAIMIEREKIKVLHNLVREISHDIQSPISAMALKIDMIDRTDADSKKHKKYLKDLRRQTFYLSQMLEHLFTLIKVESRTTLLQDIMDVKIICRDVVDDIQPLADEKRITLTLNIDDTPIPIECMVTDMRRIFINLIGNAIRYTPTGGEVTVTTAIKERKATVTIMDTGIGISEDDLPHIFKRFYRASNTADIDGTGLGLAITYQIVQQHNGDIQVQSELGKGKTFIVSLPLAKTN